MIERDRKIHVQHTLLCPCGDHSQPNTDIGQPVPDKSLGVRYPRPCIHIGSSLILRH